MGQEKKLHKTAILSLIFGCLIVIPFLGYIFGLVALILGITALLKINKNPKEYKGIGFAIAGSVLGLFSFSICSILTVILARDSTIAQLLIYFVSD